MPHEEVGHKRELEICMYVLHVHVDLSINIFVCVFHLLFFCCFFVNHFSLELHTHDCTIYVCAARQHGTN